MELVKINNEYALKKVKVKEKDVQMEVVRINNEYALKKVVKVVKSKKPKSKKSNICHFNVQLNVQCVI
jgi:hypothetical protein